MNSSLYQELSSQEISSITEHALKTQALSARLLTGGLFNTTYLVDTSRHGLTVLRVGPVNRHLLMPFEHHLMQAEQQVYALCAAHGVPASEILAMDVSKTLIDRDFMFVRHIPSQPMSQAELNDSEMARLSREIGEATGKMHAIGEKRFGRIVDVMQGGGFSLWSDCLLHELAQWETVGIPSGIFTGEEHEEVRRLFRQAVPWLDEIHEPHLVHTDLWLGNILIANQGEKKEFAAIIDADRALWGDPEFEFSSIRWTYSQETFWQGYGRPLSQSWEACVRRGIYTLLNSLWNAYVYEKEYNETENALKEASRAREEMAGLQALLRGK